LSAEVRTKSCNPPFRFSFPASCCHAVAGLQDLLSGRAYLEHTQGSSGLKMINREPWIEVTGVEVDSGSLADHQQQGRHSAQLETRGRAKKQRRSLKSSAEEGEHLTPH